MKNIILSSCLIFITLILSDCRKVKVNKIEGQWEVEIDGTKQPDELFIFKKDYNTFYGEYEGTFIRPDGKEESFKWITFKDKHLYIYVRVKVDSLGGSYYYEDTTKYVYKYNGNYTRKSNPFKFILEASPSAGNVTLKRDKK